MNSYENSRRTRILPSPLSERLLNFPVLPSTNDYLKENFERLRDGTLVRALSQSAGRGQRGNQWESDPGGLYLSLLYKPPLEIVSRLGMVPMLVSIGVRRTLLGAGVSSARIKWINDLFVEGAKVGGILVESVITGAKCEALIIGIGLNLENRVSASTIQESIRKGYQPGFLGRLPVSLTEFLSSLLVELDGIYSLFLTESVENLSDLYFKESGNPSRYRFFRDDGSFFEGNLLRLCPDGKILIESGGVARSFFCRRMDPLPDC